MLELKIKIDITGFTRSIRVLSNGMEKQMLGAAESGAKGVARNIKNRLKSNVKSSGQTISNISKNIHAGKAFYDGETITVGIGNIVDLDSATAVITKGTRKTYHLWRLLEYGFGMKGGFRSSLYDIFPVDTKFLVFMVDGRLIFSKHVRHPGAEGKHFFLDLRKGWYKEDRQIFKEKINKHLLKLLERVNYNKG